MFCSSWTTSSLQSCLLGDSCERILLTYEMATSSPRPLVYINAPSDNERPESLYSRDSETSSIARERDIRLYFQPVVKRDRSDIRSYFTPATEKTPHDNKSSKSSRPPTDQAEQHARTITSKLLSEEDEIRSSQPSTSPSKDATSGQRNRAIFERNKRNAEEEQRLFNQNSASALPGFDPVIRARESDSPISPFIPRITNVIDHSLVPKPLSPRSSIARSKASQQTYKAYSPSLHATPASVKQYASPTTSPPQSRPATPATLWFNPRYLEPDDEPTHSFRDQGVTFSLATRPPLPRSLSSPKSPKRILTGSDQSSLRSSKRGSVTIARRSASSRSAGVAPKSPTSQRKRRSSTSMGRRMVRSMTPNPDDKQELEALMTARMKALTLARKRKSGEEKEVASDWDDDNESEVGGKLKGLSRRIGVNKLVNGVF